MVRIRYALLYGRCMAVNQSLTTPAISNSGMAPGRGLEPRTLRLTDRCCPFRIRDPNSPSAVEYRQMPRFAAGVAAMGGPLSRRQAATSEHIDRGMEPGGGRDGAAGL